MSTFDEFDSASEDQRTYRQLIDESLPTINNEDIYSDDNNEGEGEEKVRDYQQELIELMRQQPSIWNTKSHVFKDKHKKVEAWKNISGELRIEGTICF